VLFHLLLTVAACPRCPCLSPAYAAAALPLPPLITPAAAAAAASQQKKPKKQAAAAGKKQLAVVGDAQLAATRPPLVRALYNEHPEVAAMTQQQVQELHEQRRTTVEGCDLRPVLSFEQTGLPANMLHATRDFVTPSPIQSQCWPIILSGHDMIGIAATGSGKTLAFGLPMLRHITAQREGGVVTGKGPLALVMAPTRELALQIAAVLEDAGSKCGISSVCVYGGVPKPPQVAALRSGVDIVVGTPGRLEDLLQDGACKLQVGAGAGLYMLWGCRMYGLKGLVAAVAICSGSAWWLM
jgi:hypothetical protein